MADLNKEELESLDRLAEPAAKECEILGKNELREEKVEEKKEEEPKLPKLSAAEFRTYNSMAEHMEYFVSSLLIFIQSRVGVTTSVQRVRGKED